MTSRAAVREHIRRQAREDVNRAIDLTMEYCASGGFMRVGPVVFEDVREFQPDPEPLDVATETSPHG